MTEEVSIYTPPPFHLSTENLTEIENLAAVNYGPSQIALYLDVNRKAFLEEFNNPNSLVRYHYNKGQLTAKFEVDNAMLGNAKKGNMTAVQIIDKHTADNILENHKRRILYGD